jgi:hypothetical protein
LACRTFEENALERLLRWGEACLETSINQPTLPHAIIVINAADIAVDEAEWDVERATSSLLDQVQASLSRTNLLSNLAKAWRLNGRSIVTVRDLIHCYYSSFTVVRIPIEGRYNLLKQQINRLRLNINNACQASYQAKRDARMLSNSDELGIFLQSAFGHFSLDLTTPFNFVEVSLRNNPIPKDFGGNILQLAIAMLQEKLHSVYIFAHMSEIVASSIHLDCVRHRRKGTSKRLDPK